ncbi:MAG: hypothetical protein LAP21_16235 [Acidobacteriia bacterium]|nr:hypothetical protein [Terriglobia bacterium]
MDLEEIDYRRLVVYIRLANYRIPDVFDGLSIDDVPNEAVQRFLNSPTGLGYDPQKGPLGKYLVGISRNILRDRLRRERLTAGSFDDRDFVKQAKASLNENLLQPPEQHRIETTEQCDKFLRAANGDPKLTELVEAIMNTDGRPNDNQLLAARLSTTTEDIVNRKKRLKRRYKQMFSSSNHRVHRKN